MSDVTVPFVKSELIGLRHGFFTREGGVSEGKLASLNVVARVGDSDDNVLVNRSRALRSLHFELEDLAFVDYLDHDEHIIAVTEAARGMDFDHYDAIMTNQSNLVIGISAADCPIVLLASEDAPAVALVHSGWRGSLINIVPKVIQAMVEEYGVDPATLKAVVGPYISPDNYEVGKDVVDQFAERYVVFKDKKYYLDLGLCIEDQLAEAGVRQIDNLQIDTFSDTRFFSHRRDKGDTGRQITLASL